MVFGAEMRRIAEHVPEKERTTVYGVFVVLKSAAARQRAFRSDQTFRMTKALLADLACVSRPTLNSVAAHLERIGLLRTSIERDERGYVLGTLWTVGAQVRADFNGPASNGFTASCVNHVDTDVKSVDVSRARTTQRGKRDKREEPPVAAGAATSAPLTASVLAERDETKLTDTQRVFVAWARSTGKMQSRLDGTRADLIRRRIASHGVEVVLAAVTGWQHSAHHRGENDRGTVYNGLDLILRNGSNVERFAGYHDRPEPAGNGNGKGHVADEAAAFLIERAREGSDVARATLADMGVDWQ